MKQLSIFISHNNRYVRTQFTLLISSVHVWDYHEVSGLQILNYVIIVQQILD